jgi:predicted metallo-beta-lactamase superfamily hydrolase
MSEKKEDWRKDFPLYPPLKDGAVQEAQILMDGFKKNMEKIAKETLSKLYCDVVMYIESDSWVNFRNEILQGFSKYGNRKLQADYDFSKIRQTIFEEHREEIIKEIEQDIIKENEKLKEQLKWEKELRNHG